MSGIKKLLKSDYVWGGSYVGLDDKTQWICARVSETCSQALRSRKWKLICTSQTANEF